MNGKTLPMGISDTSTLIQVMSKDCAPLQFLRELTQNAIEAKAKRIVWDRCSYLQKRSGLSKLCLVDDGHGMTPEEMLRYVNKLSSSDKVQSIDGNYGVGGKISALVHNPYGIIYVSKRKGHDANQVYLWYDAKGQFGLRPLELADGGTAHHAPAPPDMVHPIMSDHGTMVVLLGTGERDDTMVAPTIGTDHRTKKPLRPQHPNRWVQRYLNMRYFRLPKDVTVQARALSDDGRSSLSRITGQKDFLDSHSQVHGRTQLDGAKLHWWILNKQPKEEGGWSKMFLSVGHVAALFRNELYGLHDRITPASMSHRLQRFGIIHGTNRVVIYVEPEEALTDTARKSLYRRNGDELPWADWEKEFSSNLPADIRAFIDSTSSQENGKRQENVNQWFSDRDRLVLIHRDAARFSIGGSGAVVVARRPGSAQTAFPGMIDAQPGDAESEQRAEPKGSSERPRVYLVSSDGKPAKPSSGGSPEIPETHWIGVQDGTRTPGDLEDRAARYVWQANKMLFNRDFRDFRMLIDRWCERYSHVRGANGIVEEKVFEWSEKVLIEAVLATRSRLASSSESWTHADVYDKALSEEALSAAVHITMIDEKLGYSLRAALGKPNNEAEEAVA